MPISWVISCLIGLAVGFLLALLAGRGKRPLKNSNLADRSPAGAAGLREIRRLQEEVERHRRFCLDVPNFVRMLGENLPTSALPAIAVRFSKDLFRASQVGFFVPVKESDCLTLLEGHGFPPDWKGTIRISPEEGILGESLRSRVVITTMGYLESRPHWTVRHPSLENLGVEPEIVAPVPVSGTEKPYGVLIVAGCGPIDDTERAYAAMVADLLASAIRKGMEFESLVYDATADAVTGIANRKHLEGWFRDELQRARSYGQPLSISLIDVDFFKRVNDTYGHPNGDLVLRDIASVIRRVSRSSDLVARYGGEEFAVVMTSANKSEALICAEKVRNAVAEACLRLPGISTPLSVTVSIGVAGYPDDGELTAELLDAADRALYQAKRAGRNQVVAASPESICGEVTSEGVSMS